MKAVILAGGEGTRLRPLTSKMPKVMVPIANVPFLEHVLGYLRRYDIEEVILALGHLPDAVGDYFGDGRAFGVRMVYSIEKTPLGTAGCVKNAEEYIDGAFFVFNGDIFTDIDLGEMLELHRRQGAVATIALTPVENPTLYGVVETDGTGRVRRFVEKPPADQVTSNMINAGIYILELEAVKRIPAGLPYMFERGLFPSLLEGGAQVYAFPSSAYWIDIGTPDKYLRVNHDVVAGKMRTIASCALWPGGGPPAGFTADVEAQLEGPLALGRGCTIGRGANVTGCAVLGPDCHIGEGATVDGAVLWDNVRVGAGAVLKDCAVASGALIEEGCSVLDHSVVGPAAQIGRDNRLDRGIKVWPGRVLPPGTVSF